MNDSLIKNFFNKKQKSNFEKINNYLIKNNFKKKFIQINVVGTNGKGSTANYLLQGLAKAGFKVGLFSSPHLLDLNERIQINSKKIPQKKLEQLIKKHFSFNGSFFEIMYIIALLYFQENNCDYVVLEAGIGGRLDCTNILKGDYGLVTSISSDHENILGNTLEQIAHEKSGIIDKKMHFFANSLIDQKIKNIFQNECQKKNAFYKEIKIEKNNYKIENKDFASKILNLILKKNSVYKFQDLLGRCTITKFKKFNLIIDVSHNYDGFVKTLEYLKTEKIDFEQVVISLSADKKEKNIEKLFENKKIILYQNKSFKAKPIEKFEIKGLIIKKLNDLNLHKNTLIIGSFYFAAEFIKYLKTNKILFF